ncbi:MAG: XRE family transcriptional regulator [Acidobacteria bacterium]|nr:MAG: XRE family transcriptional regulator [Acidobacteriota bacterium]
MIRQHADTVAGSEAGRILGKAVLRAAHELGLSQADLARILGVSPASVSRLARGRPVDPDTKEGELALLLLRVYRSLSALLGGDTSAMRAWLHAGNDALGGVPAARLATAAGLVDVARYLDAFRGRL